MKISLVKRNIQDLTISTSELNEIYLMFEYKDKVEIKNIINEIYNLSPKHRFVLKPLLWNFAYFLYKWSKLKNYET